VNPGEQGRPRIVENLDGDPTGFRRHAYVASASVTSDHNAHRPCAMAVHIGGRGVLSVGVEPTVAPRAPLAGYVWV